MPLTDGEHCYWRMIKTASHATTARFSELGWTSWSRGHAPCSIVFEHHPVLLEDRTVKNPLEIPHHFGGIRRPEDWYGSLWQHTRKRNQYKDDVARHIVRYEGFKGFLYGCTHLDLVPVGDRPLVIIKPWPNKGFPDGSVGLWSWCVDYFYRHEGLWIVDDLIPADRAQEGLHELLGIENLPLKNTSVGRLSPYSEDRSEDFTDYSKWYDDEMLSWVADADKEMADFFSFSPFEPSPQAGYHFEDAASNRVKLGGSK